MCAFKLAVDAFMQNRKNRRGGGRWMDKKCVYQLRIHLRRYEWNGALIFFARTLHLDDSEVYNN